MAKITCTEHRRLPNDSNGNILPIIGNGLVVQTGLAAPSASSALTAAFGIDTGYVRICSDVALHVGGSAPATVNDDYYAAGVEIIRKVSPGKQLSYLAG